MTDVEMIQANAKLAVELLSPISDVTPFGFNRESVAWVEGYIERQRTRRDMTPEAMDRLAQVLGCFLGESIIRRYGGTWGRDENGLGVWLKDGNAAYAINKVRKQFKNGIEGGDSILSMFDLISALPALAARNRGGDSGRESE